MPQRSQNVKHAVLALRQRKFAMIGKILLLLNITTVIET